MSSVALVFTLPVTRLVPSGFSTLIAAAAPKLPLLHAIQYFCPAVPLKV